MKTAIVTDTNSSISAKEAQEMGIDLIPMPFFVDGETYLEGKDCTPETFFQRMKAGAEISTSQPAPEEITSLWDTLLKTHDAVLHFPMSSGLSGSCHTAKALAQEYGGRVPDTMEELLAYAAQLPAEAQQELMGYVSSMQAAGMDDGTIATQLMRAALSQSDGATYTGNLKRLGVSDPDDPEAINLFPKDFEAKDRIADRIAEYNKSLPEDAQLAYTDYIGLMISSITTIINAISYILIAFVAVSLVVSSIMIGIITYISVLERTREIGVLRSIGASRRDISRVFNAETLTIGFAAGGIGIGITLLLILPLNAIIHHLSGLSGVAALPAGAAVILVAISMLLTFLAGLIPSRIAAKKDPVIALRSE